MSEITYKLEPTTKKPSRKYRKGSKYDPLIEAFKKGADPLVKVGVEGKDANYIRTQINKRLDAVGDKSITVSVVNNIVYLEKGEPVKPKKAEKKPNGQPAKAGQPAPAPTAK